MDDVRVEELVNETEAEALAMVRDVVVRAHPDAVPELIAGTTIGALLASVEPARAAFSRVRERVEQSSEVVTPVAPVVPSGAANAVVDLAGLPTMELIRRGVERARR